MAEDFSKDLAREDKFIRLLPLIQLVYDRHIIMHTL